MDIELDGNKILTEADLHTALDQALDFGPYYGRNLYALRDSLSYNVAGPLRLIWKDHEVSRKAIGSPRFDLIIAILDDVVRSDADAATTDAFTYMLA